MNISELLKGAEPATDGIFIWKVSRHENMNMNVIHAKEKKLWPIICPLIV